jgi:hypothetical protein
MRIRNGLRGLLLALALTRSALGLPEYPEAVRAAVPSLACVPQCTLCHRSLLGGLPVDRPFALDLLQSGPAPDQAALRARLASLQAAGSTLDADGDGQGDYAELSASTDPNSADPAANLCGVEGVRYGCGARFAGSRPDQAHTLIGLGAITVAIALLRRRGPRAR